MTRSTLPFARLLHPCTYHNVWIGHRRTRRRPAASGSIWEGSPLLHLYGSFPHATSRRRNFHRDSIAGENLPGFHLRRRSTNIAILYIRSVLADCVVCRPFYQPFQSYRRRGVDLEHAYEVWGAACFGYMHIGRALQRGGVHGYSRPSSRSSRRGEPLPPRARGRKPMPQVRVASIRDSPGMVKLAGTDGFCDLGT
jgi:hypothetical protein